MSRPHTISRARWLLAQPIMLYLRQTRISKGKRFLTRQVLKRLLPRPPAQFRVAIGDNYNFDLLFQETIGMSILVKGGFEPGELAFLKERVMPGSVAFDVGANVGIHAVYMADAAGRMGSVYAFEPDPETAERMQAHLKLNGINNVIIMAKGVGASEGLAKLIRGCDAAYNRIVPTAGTTNVETPELVEISTLDAEWERLGRPVVSIIKIDAEGGELGVVQGATQLLKDMRPMLLVEANTAEAFERLDSFLSGYGYVASRPAEFEMWNHLFVHASRGQ